jgi:hypothetical protein
MDVSLEEYYYKKKPAFADQALAKVLDWSMRKKRKAAEHCEQLK